MSNQSRFILHHYPASPYAEKIRLWFGHLGIEWGSAETTVVPPRPTVDALTGGYRRIPVAQLGADIYCDTNLIAHVVAESVGKQDELSKLSAESQEWIDRAQGSVFFCAITAVPQLALLGTMIQKFGPFGAVRFIKDRSGMMKGGSTKPPSPAQSKAVWGDFLHDLEALLASRAQFDDGAPGYTDFCVFHPLWLHRQIRGDRAFSSFPNIQRWMAAVEQVGHGKVHALSPTDPLEIAFNSEPLELANVGDHHALGATVSVGPTDYGVNPVKGTLRAVTEDRIVIERHSPAVGRVHVHFPRSGYDVQLV